MRGTLETIVGAMFAGKTSELLKRILWAEHQKKNILDFGCGEKIFTFISHCSRSRNKMSRVFS